MIGVKCAMEKIATLECKINLTLRKTYFGLSNMETLKIKDVPAFARRPANPALFRVSDATGMSVVSGV